MVPASQVQVPVPALSVAPSGAPRNGGRPRPRVRYRPAAVRFVATRAQKGAYQYTPPGTRCPRGIATYTSRGNRPPADPAARNRY